MARPFGIDYADAVYHVTSRGTRGDLFSRTIRIEFHRQVNRFNGWTQRGNRDTERSELRDPAESRRGFSGSENCRDGREVANHLGLHYSTASRLVKEGDLKISKLKTPSLLFQFPVGKH